MFCQSGLSNQSYFIAISNVLTCGYTCLCVVQLKTIKRTFFSMPIHLPSPGAKLKKYMTIDQIKALKKLFKSRPIPFFQLYSFGSSNSSKMPCYEQILQKEQICIGFVIVISDPYSLNLTLRLNKLSHRNGIGLRLKLFLRAFISSPIFFFIDPKLEKNLLKKRFMNISKRKSLKFRKNCSDPNFKSTPAHGNENDNDYEIIK